MKLRSLITENLSEYDEKNKLYVEYYKELKKILNPVLSKRGMKLDDFSTGFSGPFKNKSFYYRQFHMATSSQWPGSFFKDVYSKEFNTHDGEYSARITDEEIEYLKVLSEAISSSDYFTLSDSFVNTSYGAHEYWFDISKKDAESKFVVDYSDDSKFLDNFAKDFSIRYNNFDKNRCKKVGLGLDKSIIYDTKYAIIRVLDISNNDSPDKYKVEVYDDDGGYADTFRKEEVLKDPEGAIKDIIDRFRNRDQD